MPEIFLICHNIRSLHNVGAIFRCADVFAVSRVYLTGYTAAPVDRLGKLRMAITKTALGAEKTIPWERISQISTLLARMKKAGTHVIALEHTRAATPLSRFRPRYPLALMLGNEVRGISPAILRRADAVVKIPMCGKKESLNVAVACGIALYALRAKSA